MKPEPHTFTAFITKHALTEGIEEVTAILVDETMIRVPRKTYDLYFHGKNWHRTRESAVQRAKAMQQAKIKSLEKQLAKIKVLNFEPSRNP